MRKLKRIMLFVLILIFAALGASGCSTSNNTGPVNSEFTPGKLLGTDAQGTYRVSDGPLAGATLDPLISPASTF